MVRQTRTVLWLEGTSRGIIFWETGGGRVGLLDIVVGVGSYRAGNERGDICDDI